MCCLFPCRHVIGSDRGMSLGPLERGFHPTSYLDTKHVLLHRFQLERDPWCTGHTLLERRETSYFMCKNIRNYYMKVDHSIIFENQTKFAHMICLGKIQNLSKVPCYYSWIRTHEFYFAERFKSVKKMYPPTHVHLLQIHDSHLVWFGSLFFFSFLFFICKVLNSSTHIHWAKDPHNKTAIWLFILGSLCEKGDAKSMHQRIDLHNWINCFFSKPVVNANSM